jgi:N,N'-diacetyllegionaminate synthase
MVRTISIDGREVGAGHPCFIIAEAGVNHNGDQEMALRLVDIAIQVGADAVKFQTFKAERVVTANAPKASYQLEVTEQEESQLEMLRHLELSEQAHRELWEYCQRRGITFMSTPFDEDSANFLADLGLTVFKIPSGEITNLPFLRHVAQKKRPMIVSTGMSYLHEVEAAVEAIVEAGNQELVLLHCVSNYPANPADANLRAMQTMATAFSISVGYSDHTLGVEVALAAVALGACMIEKHFTLDRSLPGPDHRVSLEPDELARLVRDIRTVESSLGDGAKRPVGSEAKTSGVARKSVVVARDIPAGTALTEHLMVLKRPGTGLPPTMLTSLVGRIAKKDISAGTLLTLEMLR